MTQEHRIRIDPILVRKFLRVPGGINETGVKIVRDLGLHYAYDKHSQNLDIIGPNSDILSIAIETLRFWVEDDDFPNTGVTCQVGYPNKCMVIWRFHGDYAKKLDHLFTEDITRLKKIPTVNVKAVPSKRNPEYVEMYCHFTFYNRIKDEVIRLSSELSRVCQDDFFVPYSDYMKARKFARSKANDGSVLYALKEYPDRNRVRVWIFGREQHEVIRAKREWIQHVGNINSDAEFKETILKDGGVNSARFYGHPSASTSRDSFSSQQNNLQHSPRFNQNVKQISPRSLQSSIVTSKDLSVSKRRYSTARSNKSSKKSEVKIPEFDNRNFPRPSNFVYPIDRQTVPEALPPDEDAYGSNPFNLNELNDIKEETRKESPSTRVSVFGQSGWEKTNPKFPPKHNLSKTAPNRIYVHYQVNDHQINSGEEIAATTKQVVHPETNLMPKERFKSRPSERVLTSVTDPKLAPASKRNKNLRPGNKKQLQPKVMAFTRQKPVLEANKKQSVRYHINVNGLDIYMYKHNLVKLPDMEAIVNVVNGDIKPGGHLAENILDMVGPQVADEIKIYLNTHGPLRVAENMVSSAGRLPVLGIIHVAGPIWENYLNISEEECARDLHKAIYGSLKTAEKHKYRKIGMPVISSEAFFGVPRDLVADVHVKALVDYSMGMGPLYPVLEVHLVDQDVEMLTHVKDAYEKWATDYNMVEMTQHVKSDLPSQQELSERTQSAVMLKEFPSHRSENMVTFVEQAYTTEGNQMWTFDVLKKLGVHVYTGSIVRLKDVEAIACGVNSHLKGSLARQVLNVGGLSYEVALKRARGDRDLIEGDVLVSEAGNLATDLVMHTIVTSPIHVINEKNLVRLDRVYSQVLQAANKLGIESLAMPLIGTGRLRERFEIEQCSLQLIDNVIELCLSHGKALRLRELHLVNVNNVMTQTLTQALRTRAHTKLRIETDPHPPSRQEVLSLPDHMLQTPDLQRSLLSARKPTEPDLAEEFKTLADKTRHEKRRARKFQTVEEMNRAILDKAQSEKTTTLDDKVTESITIEKDTLKTIEDIKEKQVGGEQCKGEHTSNAHNGNYLSKENLQEHTRMISNAAAKEEIPEKGKDTQIKTGKRPKPSKAHEITTATNNENNKTKTKEVDNPSKESQTAAVEKLFKPVKPRKKKRLPPLTGLVSMSSRAESYRSIHIRRQRLAAQMIKDQQVPVRRTSSVTNIHHGVDGQFQELRSKVVRKNKTKPVKGGDDDEQRENFKKEAQNYFTRGTKDRYNINKTEIKTDIMKTSRTISMEDAGLVRIQQSKGWVTERVGLDRKINRAHVKERVLWDKEREDMYMKEMDMFMLATNEAKQNQNPTPKELDNPELSESGDRAQLNQPIRTIGIDTQVRRTPGQTDARDKAIASSDSDDIKDSQNTFKSSEHNRDDSGNTPLAEPRKTTNDHGRNHVESIQSGDKRGPEIVNLNMNKPTSPINANKISQATYHPKSSMAFETSQDLEKQPNVDTSHKTDDATKQYEAARHDRNKTETVVIATESKYTASTNSTKTKPVKLVISSELLPDVVQNQVNTHEDTTEYSTASNGYPDAFGQNFNKTLTSKPNVIHQNLTPRTDDVVIRDKLTVEIDVEDNLTRESSNITREKAKIKRFWQVVGGKNVENEAELYGDDNRVENEKVLMTRVKKERKMSAKSKSSRQTDGATVTSQKLGKYNVTVEVV